MTQCTFLNISDSSEFEPFGPNDLIISSVIKRLSWKSAESPVQMFLGPNNAEDPCYSLPRSWTLFWLHAPFIHLQCCFHISLVRSTVSSPGAVHRVTFHLLTLVLPRFLSPSLFTFSASSISGCLFSLALQSSHSYSSCSTVTWGERTGEGVPPPFGCAAENAMQLCRKSTFRGSPARWRLNSTEI